MHSEAKVEQYVQATACFIGSAAVFVAGYQLTLRHAARIAPEVSSALAWDVSIPFVAWTILPYAALNIIAAIAFYLCPDRRSLLRYTAQLLSVMLVSFVIFWVWPLTLAHTRPTTEGIWLVLFKALASFDAPYNMLPSLHIAVLLPAWHVFLVRASHAWRWVIHSAALLVAASALTTWQHHILDVIAGAALGITALMVWNRIYAINAGKTNANKPPIR